MSALDLTTLATPAAGLVSVLLDAAVKGTAILLLTAGLAVALGRAAASTRHLVWTLGIGAVLLLPALSVVAPRWEVPLGAVIGSELGALGTGWEAAAATEVAVVPRAIRTESADATQGAGTWRGARGREREAAVAIGADPIVPRAAPLGPPAAVQEAQRAPAVATGEAPAALRPGAPRSAPHAESAAPRSAPLATPWPLLVVLFWLAGTLPMSVAIVASIRHARGLARRATPLPPGRTARMVRHLSARLGLPRPVTVLEGPRGGMPITWGAFRPVVLLPVDAEAWDDDRLRAVLLHELAHVKRHDYLTQLLARAACAVFWFNPLVWVAAVRLRVERELACDDVVLSAGSRPSDYAGHLLEIARSLKAGTVASVASIAMARPSQLSGRLLAVLDADRRRSAISRRLAVLAWVAALGVAVPLAGATAGAGGSPIAAETRATTPFADSPPVADDSTPASWNLAGPAVNALAAADGLDGQPQREGQLPCGWGDARRDGSESYSASYTVDDDDVHIRIRMGDCRLEIDAAGQVSFNETETDVVAITPGGYFEIEEREGRATRRMEMQPVAGGALQRRWIVNGQIRWTVTGDVEGQDAEASAWLARLIPEMFRRTGFQAEERARRILGRSGVDGLLTEVAQIPSDHAERQYLTVLLTEADLSPAQLLRVVEQAALGVSSDFELAELLIAVAQSHPVDEAVMAAYVAAAGTISSDYEHRRVLTAILARQDLSRAVADAMLQSAGSISSDYELAELLIGIVEAHAIDRMLTPAFFAAVNTIDSDFEHRRVLRAVLTRGAPSLEVLDRSLETAVNINSDFELAELLLQVAKLYPVDQGLPASYLAAAQTVNSDFESRRAWQALVQRGNLTPETLRALLVAAKGIGSDFELAELLIDVVEGHTLDATTRPAFFEAVGTIASDFEQSRVLRALAGAATLDQATVEGILQASLEIASDHELATLLVAVAQRHGVNEALRPAFFEAANTLNDFERGRAMNAVFPRGN